jgi:hypothetical protein
MKIIKKIIKGATKEILKEMAMEQLIAKANEIAKKNEELEAQIALLKPNKVEYKKQVSYIG